MDHHYMNGRPPPHQPWWNRPPAPPPVNNQGHWQGPPPPSNWNNNGWPRGPPPPDYPPPTHHRPPDPSAAYHQNWWGHNSGHPQHPNHQSQPYWGHGMEAQPGVENWDRSYEHSANYGREQGGSWERDYYRHEYRRERSRSPRDMEKYPHSGRHSSRDRSREHGRKHREYKTSSKEREKASEKERYSHEKEMRASSDRHSRDDRYSEGRTSSRDKSHRSERDKHSDDSRRKTKKDEPSVERDQNVTKSSESKAQEEKESKEADTSSSESDVSGEENADAESNEHSTQRSSKGKTEQKLKKEETKPKEKTKEKKKYEKDRESSKERSRIESRYSDRSSTSHSHRTKYDDYDEERYKRDRYHDYRAGRKREQDYYDMQKRHKYGDRYAHRYYHERFRESYKSSESRDRDSHRVEKYVDYEKYYGHRDAEDDRKSEKNVINLFNDEGPAERSSVKSKVSYAKRKYIESSDYKKYEADSRKSSERRTKYDELKSRSSDETYSVSKGRKASIRSKTKNKEISENESVDKQKPESKKKPVQTQSSSSSSDSDSDSSSGSSSGSGSSSDSNSEASFSNKLVDYGRTDDSATCKSATEGEQGEGTVIKKYEVQKEQMIQKEHEVVKDTDNQSSNTSNLEEPMCKEKITHSELNQVDHPATETAGVEEPSQDASVMGKVDQNVPRVGECSSGHTDRKTSTSEGDQSQVKSLVLKEGDSSKEKEIKPADSVQQAPNMCSTREQSPENSGSKSKKVKITFKSSLASKRPPVQPSSLDLISKEDLNLEPASELEIPSPQSENKTIPPEGDKEVPETTVAEQDMEQSTSSDQSRVEESAKVQPDSSTEISAPTETAPMECQSEVVPEDTKTVVESSQMEVSPQKDEKISHKTASDDSVQTSGEILTSPSSVSDNPAPKIEQSLPEPVDPTKSNEISSEPKVEATNSDDHANQTIADTVQVQGISNHEQNRAETMEEEEERAVMSPKIEEEVKKDPPALPEVAVGTQPSGSQLSTSCDVNVSSTSKSTNSKTDTSANVNINGAVKKGSDRNIFQIMDNISNTGAKSAEARSSLVDNLQKRDLAKRLDKKDEKLPQERVETKQTASQGTKPVDKTDVAQSNSACAANKRPTPEKEVCSKSESTDTKVSPQTVEDKQQRDQPAVVETPKVLPKANVLLKPKPRRHAKWAQWKASHSITDLYKGSSNGLTVLPQGVNVESSLLPEAKLGLGRLSKSPEVKEDSRPDISKGSKELATRISENVTESRNKKTDVDTKFPSDSRGSCDTTTKECLSNSSDKNAQRNVNTRNIPTENQGAQNKTFENKPKSYHGNTQSDIKTKYQDLKSGPNRRERDEASQPAVSCSSVVSKSEVSEDTAVSNTKYIDSLLLSGDTSVETPKSESNQSQVQKLPPDEKSDRTKPSETEVPAKSCYKDNVHSEVRVSKSLTLQSDAATHNVKEEAVPMDTCEEKKTETIAASSGETGPTQEQGRETNRAILSPSQEMDLEPISKVDISPAMLASKIIKQECEEKSGANEGNICQSMGTEGKGDEFDVAGVLLDSDNNGLEKRPLVQCDTSQVQVLPLENFSRADWDELLSRQTDPGPAKATSKHKSQALDKKRCSSSYQTQSESSRNKDTFPKSSLASNDSENEEQTRSQLFKSTANANTTRSSIIPIPSASATDSSGKRSPLKDPTCHASSDSPSYQSEQSKSELPTLPSTHSDQSSDIQVVEYSDTAAIGRPSSATTPSPKGKSGKKVTEAYREYFGTETEESDDWEDANRSKRASQSPTQQVYNISENEEQPRTKLLKTNREDGSISHAEERTASSPEEGTSRNLIEVYHVRQSSHFDRTGGGEVMFQSKPGSSSPSTHNTPQSSSVDDNSRAMEEIYYESSSIDIAANETVIFNQPAQDRTRDEVINQPDEASPSEASHNEPTESEGEEIVSTGGAGSSKHPPNETNTFSEKDTVEMEAYYTEPSGDRLATPLQSEELSGDELAPPTVSEVEVGESGDEELHGDKGEREPVYEDDFNQAISELPPSRRVEGVYLTPDEISNASALYDRENNEFPEVGGSPSSHEDNQGGFSSQIPTCSGDAPPGTEPVLLPVSARKLKGNSGTRKGRSPSGLVDVVGVDGRHVANPVLSLTSLNAATKFKVSQLHDTLSSPARSTSRSSSYDRQSHGHTKSPRSQAKRRLYKRSSAEEKAGKHLLPKSKAKKKHSKKKKSNRTKKSKSKDKRKKRSHSPESESSLTASERMLRKSKKRSRRSSTSSSRERAIVRLHRGEEYERRDRRGRYLSSDEDRSVQGNWSRRTSRSRSRSSEDRRRRVSKDRSRKCQCGGMRKPADEEIRDFFYRRALAGYCLVEFPTPEAAHHAMTHLSGRPVYDLSSPRKFLPNRDSTEQSTSTEYVLRVDNLSRDVDDLELFRVFARKFPSCRSVKVEYDSSQRSLGYGFVHFAVEADYVQALSEMQGYSGIGKKSVRISGVTPIRSSRSDTDVTGDPCQAGPALSPWKSETSGNPHTGRADPSVGNTPVDDEEEEALCDPLEPIDIEAANREFMEKAEVLYEDLEISRWQIRGRLNKTK